MKVGVVEEHVRCKTSNTFSVIVAKSNSQTPSRFFVRIDSLIMRCQVSLQVSTISNFSHSEYRVNR